MARWRKQLAAGEPPAQLVAPLGPELKDEVVAVVRGLRGLIGAEAIRHAVPGVSRRQAAAVKHETLTAMERERKAAAATVEVTTAGAVRGFDAMYLATTAGRRFALVAADAAMPYRTTAAAVPAYDGHAVAAHAGS
ncbi:MAG: hypothetical protein QM767_23845 [Anaeromyxobacter sp.]